MLVGTDDLVIKNSPISAIIVLDIIGGLGA